MATKFLSRDNIAKVLDALIVTPSWRKAMGKIGASEQLAFQWAAKSRNAELNQDRNSDFHLEWPEESGIFDYFHRHYDRARAANISLYESHFRDESLNGREIPIIGPNGRQSFEEREEYIGRSDEFVMFSEGLEDTSEVAFYRIKRDEKGRPVPLVRVEFPAATMRIKSVELDPRFVHREEHNLNVSGQVLVQPPLTRLPGEAAPNLSRLKQLAAMPREDRIRAIAQDLGTKVSAVPLDQDGRRTLAAGAMKMDDADDAAGRGLRPAAPAFQRPPAAPQPARPSYARPLDTSGRGSGEPPEGGAPANGPGMVR